MYFPVYKGTIRTDILSSLYRLRLNFNSIKVQLERNYGSGASIDNKFQFHKGAIRTCGFSTFNICWILYFNSIKVQLEQSLGRQGASGGLEFQFHKGTIRTLQLITCSVTRTNFNSIKVQLEPEDD